jgi:hypothetical protein
MTTTREDREAAASSYYGDAFREHAGQEYVVVFVDANNADDLLSVDPIGHDRVQRLADRFAAHREAAVKAERSAVVGYLLAFTASRMRKVLAYDIANGEHTKVAFPSESNATKGPADE